MKTKARYNIIGVSHAQLHQLDSRLVFIINDALGSAKTSLNVGAGIGSYEPVGRERAEGKESFGLRFDMAPKDLEQYVRVHTEGKNYPYSAPNMRRKMGAREFKVDVIFR